MPIVHCEGAVMNRDCDGFMVFPVDAAVPIDDDCSEIRNAGVAVPFSSDLCVWLRTGLTPDSLDGTSLLFDVDGDRTTRHTVATAGVLCVKVAPPLRGTW